MKKLTTNDFIKKAKGIHGEKYDYSLVNYLGCKKKIYIICSIHGKFVQTPNDHLNECGCLLCGINKRTFQLKNTIKDFIEKSNICYNSKYNYSKFIYINSKTKGEIICSHHGSFWKTPNKHINGSECPKCTIEKLKKLRSKKLIDILKEFKTVHGNKYNYSKFEYINTHKKSIIICKFHGEFLQTAHDHKIGIGCPSCARVKPLTTKEFIQRAILKHKKLYNYSNTIFKNFKTKVNIICPKHGYFYQNSINHLNGSGCPKCVGIISKKEIKFLDYLKIPNNINHRQKIINGIKVDGYKDDKIYEFLGDYWHGNPKKFHHKNINKTCKKTFKKLYNETFNRLNKLKNSGYKVYYIWENDWNNWNKKKIKTFPIKLVSGQEKV